MKIFIFIRLGGQLKLMDNLLNDISFKDVLDI